MKNLGNTFFIVLIALIGYLFLGSWYWSCKVKGLCGGAPPSSRVESPPPATPVAEPSLQTPFAVNYKGETMFAAEEGIFFARHQATPAFKLGVRQQLGKMLSYLEQNPNTDLLVTGLYASDDSLPPGQDASNLGLARANAMKSEFVGSGIEANRIFSFYERLTGDRLYDERDTLRGGLRFELVDRAPAEGLNNPLEAAYNVHFETGSAYVPLDSSLRATITQTLQFLAQQPEKKLMLTGHTDNVGNATKNMTLGKERAEQLARYFRDFGLDLSRIDTDSRGQDQPITTNDTDEGRAQNRRVEMRIP